MDGLLRAQFAYPNVTFRYIIQPTKDLPSSTWPYNMSQKKMDKVIAQGEADAKSLVINGNGNGTEDVLHFHSLKKGGDKRINKLSFGKFLNMKEQGTFESYDATKDKRNPLYLL